MIIPQPDENGILRLVFTQPGLVTISHALQSCRTIFAEIAKLLSSAFQQVEGPSTQRSRIKLSTRECAKWPFLQPQFDELWSDLRDSKGNLLLLVALASLRHVIRDGQQRPVHGRERLGLGSTIVQLQRARIGDEAEITSSNNNKRFWNVKNIFQSGDATKEQKRIKAEQNRSLALQDSFSLHSTSTGIPNSEKTLIKRTHREIRLLPKQRDTMITPSVVCDCNPRGISLAIQQARRALKIPGVKWTPQTLNQLWGPLRMFKVSD